MPIQKLASTDAFVVVDIADAPATGLVRMAPKILESSAQDLARSATYTFAVFGQQRSGASAGINATGDATSDAVASFVDELREVVSGGGLHLDAGKGVTTTDLAALAEVDNRNTAGSDPSVRALGVLAATAWALGGSVEGERVAIEGTGPIPAVLAQAFSAAGATVVTPDGLDTKPWLIWGADVAAICPGSKPGILTDQGAGMVKATAIVPWGPIPVGTKAFAQLRRNGIEVLPDFISAAGTLLGGYIKGPTELVGSQVADQISAKLEEVSGHEHGVLLAACYRAEEFLGTWTDAKLFGRPLAA